MTIPDDDIEEITTLRSKLCGIFSDNLMGDNYLMILNRTSSTTRQFLNNIRSGINQECYSSLLWDDTTFQQ